MRTVKQEKIASANDVRHLSFSEDDALLFSILRDGRVVCRETENWKVKPWAKGMERSAKDLNISGDGEFITGRTSKGPFLWTKAEEKAKPLKTGARAIRQRF